MNKTRINDIFTKQFTFKESFLFYLALFSVYILPLITSGIHYRDDYVRALRGNDWDILGRKLTDLLMYTTSINFNSILNISPLNYIIIILLFSFTLALFVHKNFIEKNIFNHIACSFFVLSPFFLQNLYYQYDSLSMSLSLCLVLIAYTLDWDKHKNLFIAALFLVLSAALFQPVTNVFIALLVSGFIFGLKDEERSYKKLFKGIIIYIVGLSVYFIWFKYLNPVAATDRGKIIDINITSIKDQTILSLDLFWTILKPLLSSPISLFLIVAFIGFTIYIIKNIITIKGLLKKITILISPVILIFTLWGPFILLDEAFSEARVYISFGVILFSLLLGFIKIFNNKHWLLSLVLGFSVLNAFSLIYISTNLLKEEDKFNNQLSEWISYDINSRPELLKYKTVYINSFPPRAPNSKITLNNIPFLQYINTPFNVWISRYVIESKGVKNIYKDINNMDDKYDWNAICVDKSVKPIIINQYYEIYVIKNELTVNKEHLSVWFKRRPNLCDDPKNVDFRKYYIKLKY